MEESKRFKTGKSFLDFCERLLEKEYDLSPYNLGETSRVFGSAGSFGNIAGVQAEETRRRNRLESLVLLRETEFAKKDFPRTAKRYEVILSRAEDVWTSLAGRTELAARS